MPNKVTELCNAIKAAQKVAGEIFSGNHGISTTSFHRKVSVDSFRDLEQVSGDVEFRERNHGPEFPWRASKVFDGTEFYVLLTQENYEAAKQAS